MKNYFKEFACILFLLSVGNTTYAQLSNDERMIKDMSFRLSYRPSFSTLPANTWFDRFEELNVLPIMIEIPINESRFSLRFFSIVGVSSDNESTNNWGGPWNPILPNHINENAPKSLFKTFGGEFSILYYFKKNKDILDDFYIASNFGIAYHPRYYYQTYKITVEIGYNWVSQNNDFCYGLGLELGDGFRHSNMQLNKMYQENNPIIMPKFSIGYIFN